MQWNQTNNLEEITICPQCNSEILDINDCEKKCSNCDTVFMYLDRKNKKTLCMRIYVKTKENKKPNYEFEKNAIPQI